MTNFKENYEKTIRVELQKEFGYKSAMEIPKITAVSINVGSGAIKDSDAIGENIASDLAKITGQKPRANKARKSISSFKLREGQIVGYSVTLRGERMYDFIERLVKVALPRIRDFRGLSNKSFDGHGNYSIGMREQVIFPEMKFDDIKEVFGLQINIKTTAKNDAEAKKLLTLFGFPFAKELKA